MNEEQDVPHIWHRLNLQSKSELIFSYATMTLCTALVATVLFVFVVSQPTAGLLVALFITIAWRITPLSRLWVAYLRLFGIEAAPAEPLRSQVPSLERVTLSKREEALFKEVNERYGNSPAP